MKTALITGASRGIGKETAVLLAQSGSFDCIAVTCRSQQNSLHETAKIIRKEGISCIESCGDIGDFSYVQTLTEQILAETGRIDLLVNNAAVSYIGLLTDMTLPDWDSLLRTNLTSVFNTCRLIVPGMVQRKDGKVINISSVWGISGASCEAAYSASKGAVNAFTRALAKELAPSGISVNAIAFGAVDTDMNKQLTSEERNALAQEIPAGRMVSSKEAAQAVLKLYEMPSYFTGEIVKFDGGWI